MPCKVNAHLTLVGGKGGVGKTTVAAALAVAEAERGAEVLVMSVDPAHSLGDALGVALGSEPVPVPGLPRLRALEVDAEAERRRFLDGSRGALLSLLERGTYLDSSDAAGFVDLAVPGMDELAALFRLRALQREFPRLVVDTAPTGHTLRLLDLPGVARQWVSALRAMEEKHRAVTAALVGAHLEDEATRLLDELDDDLSALAALLTDPERTGFVLVTTREPVVLAETLRYQEELARRRIRVEAVVVNRASGAAPAAPDGVPMRFVPSLPEAPIGVQGLRRFAGFLQLEEEIPAPETAPAPPVPAAGPAPLRLGGQPFLPPLDRQLYLVGGKGGVGKSTVAAALAVTMAAGGRRVLLLGADPAGSLGEVLDGEIPEEAREVEGVTGLFVRQLNAGAAWEELRERYRADAERIFAGLLGGGATATADRAVVERLIDLAPPGLDELVALVEVVDAMEDRLYDALVLDTAPTGHFLRLLELPELALAWTHQLMRLLLKYREVIAPGELAEELLRLSRSLRRFSERLRDPRVTCTLLVALPEALSLPETERLVQRLGGMGIVPAALLLNRLRPSGEAAPVARELLALPVATLAAAPEQEEGPRGPEALAAFARSWRLLAGRGRESSERGEK